MEIYLLRIRGEGEVNINHSESEEGGGSESVVLGQQGGSGFRHADIIVTRIMSTQSLILVTLTTMRGDLPPGQTPCRTIAMGKKLAGWRLIRKKATVAAAAPKKGGKPKGGRSADSPAWIGIFRGREVHGCDVKKADLRCIQCHVVDSTLDTPKISCRVPPFFHAKFMSDF